MLSRPTVMFRLIHVWLISNARDLSQQFSSLLQIDIPLRPSQKSRSLVWKNWSRMHIFDFTKRMKNPDDTRNTPSPETINKRQKAALTLSDFSKRFNYRSMRNKARKMCSRNQSAMVMTNAEPNSDKSESDASNRAASTWRSFVIYLCNKLFDCI